MAAQWLVTPLARDMAIIRPAMPPYGPGLFVNVAMTEVQSIGIRGHKMLKELVPEGRFVGEKTVSESYKVSKIECF